MAENRKDQRAKVPGMSVRFKSATVDEFIEQPANNVGRGGMFVTSSAPFPAGTLLKFELRADGEAAAMAGVARVVWKRDGADATDERPAGMGVKFIKIDDKSKALLGTLVDKHASAGDAPPPDAPKDEEKVAVVPKRASTMLGLGSIGTPTKKDEPKETPKEDGGFFPKTNPEAEMPPPEERTVMKQAAELLQQALAESGGSIEGLEAPKPKAPAPEKAKAEEPPAPPPPAEEPVAEEKATAVTGIAAAIAETVAAHEPAADEKPVAEDAPPEEKKPEAKKPAEEPAKAAPKAEAAPKKAEAAPKKAEAKPAAKEPEKAAAAKPAAPVLSAAAEPEEGGGSGRMLMILLAAAAIGGGLYVFLSGSDDKPTTPEKPVATQAATSKPTSVEPPKTAAPAPTPTPTPTPAESASAAPTAAASASAAPAAPPAKTADPVAPPAATPKPAAPPKPVSTPAAAAPPKPKPPAAPKPKKDDDIY